MNNTELRIAIAKLSAELNIPPQYVLGYFTNYADNNTLEKVLTKLKKEKTIRRLKQYFKFSNDTRITETKGGYDNEFSIFQGSNKKLIEVVTKKEAIESELDFIDSPDERISFLQEIASEEQPLEIGAYKRVDQDLYYREM